MTVTRHTQEIDLQTLEAKIAECEEKLKFLPHFTEEAENLKMEMLSSVRDKKRLESGCSE